MKKALVSYSSCSDLKELSVPSTPPQRKNSIALPDIRVRNEEKVSKYFQDYENQDKKVKQFNFDALDDWRGFMQKKFDKAKEQKFLKTRKLTVKTSQSLDNSPTVPKYRSKSVTPSIDVNVEEFLPKLRDPPEPSSLDEQIELLEHTYSSDSTYSPFPSSSSKYATSDRSKSTSPTQKMQWLRPDTKLHYNVYNWHNDWSTSKSEIKRALKNKIQEDETKLRIFQDYPDPVYSEEGAAFAKWLSADHFASAVAESHSRKNLVNITLPKIVLNETLRLRYFNSNNPFERKVKKDSILNKAKQLLVQER